MELSANDIAKLVNGRLTGNGNAVISGAAGLDEATPADASFFRDVKKTKSFAVTKAGVVFVPRGVPTDGKTVIEVENPIEAFSVFLNKLASEKNKARSGISPLATVAPSARVGKNVFIGPFCIVEDDAQIGDNVSLLGNVYVGARTKVGAETIIYPQAVLREGISVGARCVIHPGVILGADGFGFYFAKGKHNKIPQIGTVIIEDDVEIGASSTIDRAMTGATVIGKGTKIDNLVQIGHNVQIGENSILVAAVAIAGSCTIGKDVIMGGQVGVADHIKIGDGAHIGGQSGVIQDVEPGAVLYGNPAQPLRDSMKQSLLMRKLPELFEDVKELKGKKDGGGKTKNV